jgi:hypothetical protein
MTEIKVPEIKYEKIKLDDLESPKGLKKLFDLLSEFGFVYKYDSKKDKIRIRGEIDWCDNEFISISDGNIDMGISIFKKYSVIRVRYKDGENIKIKDIYIPHPIKFNYFHQYRELILDLDYYEDE